MINYSFAFMDPNYQVYSLLPKSIDSDSSGTTSLKISPILKFQAFATRGNLRSAT